MLLRDCSGGLQVERKTVELSDAQSVEFGISYRESLPLSGSSAAVSA